MRPTCSLAAALLVSPLLATLALAAPPPKATTPASPAAPAAQQAKAEPKPQVEKVVKTPAEWKKQLTKLQYEVLREKGTEPSRTGKYLRNKAHGTYHCAACGHPLFSSETKYESGSGWPAFWAPLNDEALITQVDKSLMHEVVCTRCDGHLGHVFTDGPQPTGKRYCINSASLTFKKTAKK